MNFKNTEHRFITASGWFLITKQLRSVKQRLDKFVTQIITKATAAAAAESATPDAVCGAQHSDATGDAADRRQ